MQVYACVYSVSTDNNSKNVIICHKPAKGYYFTGDPSGSIKPRGQRLNGARKNCLPGGKLERDETVEAGAAREWAEETARSVDDLDFVGSGEWGKGEYAAAYFQGSPESIDKLALEIASTNLPDAMSAAAEIRKGAIATYEDIFTKYPWAPGCNELDGAEIWNLDAQWGEIEKWKNDGDLSWYYTILEHLKSSM